MKKKELDMIAVEMFQYPKNNQRSEYPCYMFSKGITNLTLLTASECVGVAFVLAIFMVSSCGQHFWSNVNKRLQPTGESILMKRGIHQKYNISENSGLSLNNEVPSGIICDAMDILNVLEMNLAFFHGTIEVNLFLLMMVYQYLQ